MAQISSIIESASVQKCLCHVYQYTARIMQWREQELLDVLRNETLKTGDPADRVDVSRTTALKYHKKSQSERFYRLQNDSVQQSCGFEWKRRKK